MQVACPSCAHVITVPPEKAALPNLKAKCRCGTLFPVTPPPVPAHAPEKPRSVPVPWRRCQSHPAVRAEHVCPSCAKGYCDPCTQKVQTAAVCPACDGLCVTAAAYEQLQDKARQRERTMLDEIPVIFRYPLGDPIAYVMLALFTWFFGLLSGLAFMMLVLSKGVLTWYSFNAVSKVSIGNLRDVMPELRDASDLFRALRLSVAALAISGGPLLLCLLLIPGAQFDADRDGAGSVFGPLVLLGIVIAAIWLLVYLPVALTVAALSRSILSTLNPLIGVDTIKKMGGTYGQALALYAAIVFVQLLLGWGLRHIPFAGGLAASFVDAYAALAIGCTLGMAVFKKGPELGWD